MEQEHYEFLEYAQQAGVSDILKGERTGENFTVFVPSFQCFQSKQPLLGFFSRDNEFRNFPYIFFPTNNSIHFH